MPRCLLYYVNVVKAESRTKQIYLFFMPRCLLYYVNVVKAESRINKFIFFAKVPPILCKFIKKKW